MKEGAGNGGIPCKSHWDSLFDTWRRARCETGTGGAGRGELGEERRALFAVRGDGVCLLL